MTTRFSVDTGIEVFPALPDDTGYGHLLHLENVGNVTIITPVDEAVDLLAYARQVADLATATADGAHMFTARYLDLDTGDLLHEGDLNPGADSNMDVTLTGTSGSRINVHQGGRQIGHVWWNATAERWYAEAADGTPIGGHQLRVRAVDLVADHARKVNA